MYIQLNYFIARNTATPFIMVSVCEMIMLTILLGWTWRWWTKKSFAEIVVATTTAAATRIKDPRKVKVEPSAEAITSKVIICLCGNSCKTRG